MNKINTDLSKILKPKYSNKWVALNKEQTKIVASGKTISSVLNSLRKFRVSEPVLIYVIKDYRSLVPII